MLKLVRICICCEQPLWKVEREASHHIDVIPFKYGGNRAHFQSLLKTFIVDSEAV